MTMTTNSPLFLTLPTLSTIDRKLALYKTAPADVPVHQGVWTEAMWPTHWSPKTRDFGVFRSAWCVRVDSHQVEVGDFVDVVKNSGKVKRIVVTAVHHCDGYSLCRQAAVGPIFDDHAVRASIAVNLLVEQIEGVRAQVEGAMRAADAMVPADSADTISLEKACELFSNVDDVCSIAQVLSVRGVTVRMP